MREISHPNVVAVDFGMSSLRVAYCMGDSKRVQCLPLQYSSDHAPNVLLMKTNEHTGLTEAEIGYHALNQYQLEYNNTDHVYYQFNSEVNSV